jgi:hypothetical protein
MISRQVAELEGAPVSHATRALTLTDAGRLRIALAVLSCPHHGDGIRVSVIAAVALLAGDARSHHPGDSRNSPAGLPTYVIQHDASADFEPVAIGGPPPPAPPAPSTPPIATTRALPPPTQPQPSAKQQEKPLEKAEPPRGSQLTDLAIAALIVKASRASYSGNCACPDNTDRAGRRCGARSAYSRPGGSSPMCYERDVPVGMIAEWRSRNRR